mgnify:CR=1 FL=1
MQGVSNYHSNSAVSPEMAHNTKISSFDYLLLQNTTAKTPMTIVGCMCCEATATIEQVRRTALTLVTVHERLRCRVVGREWIEAEDFNVLEHTQEICVRPPEALTSVLEEYVANELPEDRPLWHMTLIHDLNANQDVVVFRCHHSIGDGLALVQLINWLFDNEQQEMRHKAANLLQQKQDAKIALMNKKMREKAAMEVEVIEEDSGRGDSGRGSGGRTDPVTGNDGGSGSGSFDEIVASKGKGQQPTQGGGGLDSFMADRAKKKLR